MANRIGVKWRKRARRLLQSKRGKLLFVLTWVFVLFALTHVLEYFVPPHQQWHLSCRADGYFDPQQAQITSSVVSELLLTFTLEYQDAALRYHLGNESLPAESIVLQGNVVKVDFGALNYALQMQLKSKKLNNDSMLLDYLLNELAVGESQLLEGDLLPLQVQILNANDDQLRATLTFIPSNSIWSCEIIPAVLPQPH
ncbi:MULTISPECIES: hypothetical protein [Shewanella]|uniref:DUF2140 family protein n=1 Tax=Shewanella metallivivens TaxID=2872342 RepID=A0ABT5TS24_9GAMM|nr:hypothetical protein [Shewanella metallivivens]MDD8061324.1 hypothetical protein [Shewanella metallivivens]